MDRDVQIGFIILAAATHAGASHQSVVRVTQVLGGGTLTRTEKTGQCAEQGFREAAAVSAGVRSAVAVCRERSGSKGHARQSGPLRSWFILATIMNLCGYFTLRLSAQQGQQPISYEGERVAFVDLVARPGVDVESLRPLILQKAEEAYANEKIQSSVAALGRTGQFSKVEVEVTPEAAGLRVVFVMQPAFYIGMIYFPGALKAFTYPRLLQVVNYPAEEPYEESRVKTAETALLHFFTGNGYFLAGVETETKLDESHKLVDVVFHITLNRRAKLGRIEVAGVPAKEAALLERALRSFRARLKGASVKSGKPYDLDRLQAATTFIRDTLGKQNRLASQVRLEPPYYNPERNRADLSFQVTLGPTVVVRTAGARVPKRTLRKLIPIYEENAFDQDLVEEGERNLVSYFQAKGYFDVKVNPQTEDDPSQVSVVYQIDKGNRHRVMQVAIAGNHHFEEEDLLPQVEIQKARLFSRGRFSNELLNRSVDKLTAYYRDAGFEDVKVQPKVVDREPKVYVTFQITEGPRTIVDALHLEGNKTQPIGKLAPDGLNLRPGRPYSQQLSNQDRDQIMATYLDLGYLNAVFKSTVKPVPDRPNHVEVTYAIEEGPQARIASVVTLGEEHTRKQFIDRTADVRAGRPLSQGKLLGSESRLYNTGIFDWAGVGPRQPITDQPEEDVLVKVHEAKRNTVSYGVGFELSPRVSNVGTVALPGLPLVGLPTTLSLTQKQFASPRGSVEYTRHNLRGLGETASVAALVARLDQRASFTYAEPHFRGLNWSSLFSLSAERTSENPIFTARLGEASFQLERPLDTARTKTLLFRYSFRRTTLTNIPAIVSDLVLPQDRSVRLSTLSTSFVHDTRDKPLDAHKGVYQTVDFGISPKVIGSSANFARFLGQSAYYRQVRPWLVWANNVHLGLAKPFAGSDVPLSERFFSGGAASLRGFPVNGAGPQRTVQVCTNPSKPTPSTCANIRVPVGGNELFIVNSEGRFPIRLKKGLGGVLFYDGGNVYDRIGFKHFFSDYSNTAGFGLRYDTPVGPIRFDIGRNLSPVPGFKATQYFITLGQSF
jgi:outer membrane protein insertion porin family